MRSIALALAAAVLLLLASAPPATASPGWQWPVRGQVITPYRNGSDPYAGGQHRGIDIVAPVGTPVVAATAGTVTFAGLVGSSGLAVAVRTADSRLDTSYLHLSSIQVAAGDRVAAGDSLGAVGTTGRRTAAEPHLHFGVRDAGSRFAYHDPLDFLPVAPPSPSPPPATAPRALPVPVGVAAGPRLAPAPTTKPAGISANVDAPLVAVAAPVAAAGAAHAAGLGTSARLRQTKALASLPAAARDGIAQRHPVPHRAGGATAASPPAVGPRAAHVPARPSARIDRLRPGMSLRAAARRRSGGQGDGFDPGWFAACIGLVAAALALGRPTRTARSVRHAFAPSRRALHS